MKHFFISLAAVLFTGMVFNTVPAKSQTVVLIENEAFQDAARSAIDSLYNRNNEGAGLVLRNWKQNYPDHPIWSLWDGMELWWEVLEDLSNESRDKEFIYTMQKADYEAGELLRKEPDHPDALIIRSVANGYIARHHSNREDWITSLNIARRAFQAHQRLITIAPHLPDNSLAEGLKLYYAAYLPEAYPVVKAVSWFLPSGDKQGGLDHLKTASEEGVFSGAEATYFLGNILLNYEGEYEEATRHFEYLIKKYPDNDYYRRLLVRTLAQRGQYARVILETESTLKYWAANNLNNETVLEEELYYWKGRAQYHGGNLEGAKVSFAKSLDAGEVLPNRKKRTIRTLSSYYAGRTSEGLNQTDDARRYYRQAMDQNDGNGARDSARDRLRNL
ncbi:MAG: tetratricopeptide repeat protein [Balneolaceae bacterium]